MARKTLRYWVLWKCFTPVPVHVKCICQILSFSAFFLQLLFSIFNIGLVYFQWNCIFYNRLLCLKLHIFNSRISEFPQCEVIASTIIRLLLHFLLSIHLVLIFLYSLWSPFHVLELNLYYSLSL